MFCANMCERQQSVIWMTREHVFKTISTMRKILQQNLLLNGFASLSLTLFRLVFDNNLFVSSFRQIFCESSHVFVDKINLKNNRKDSKFELECGKIGWKRRGLNCKSSFVTFKKKHFRQYPTFSYSYISFFYFCCKSIVTS